MRKILFIAIKDMYSSIERLLAEKAGGKAASVVPAVAPRRQAIIVGRLEQGGEVICVSPEAKDLGIFPGMLVSRARRRVPPGTSSAGTPLVKFVRFDPERYRPYYQQVRSVLERYSPLVEPATFRETYLDITGCEDLFGLPEVIAEKIVRDIRAETHLDAFVGCGESKLVAKLACREMLDRAERAGQDAFFLEVPSGDVSAFLKAMPLGRLDELNEEVRAFLDRVGVRTFGALAEISRKQLLNQFGEIGEVVYELARGIDERPVTTRPQAKVLSATASYNPDLAEEDEVLKEIFKLSEEVAYKLRSKSLKGNVIILKLTLSNLKELVLKKVLRQGGEATCANVGGTKAAAKTAGANIGGTDIGAAIYRVSGQAYLKSRLGNKRIKKICLQVSGFGLVYGAAEVYAAAGAEDRPYQQPSLFSIYALGAENIGAANEPLARFIPGMDRTELLRQTSDKLRIKFGKGALFPAKLK